MGSTPVTSHVAAIMNLLSVFGGRVLTTDTAMHPDNIDGDKCRTLEIVNAGLHCSLRMSKQILPLLLILG
jgi:hypothetical protein